jgi:hypothetical protein
MDRVRSLNDGFEDAVAEGVQVDSTGEPLLFYLGQLRDQPELVSHLQFKAPKGAKALLPDFAEAVGGVAIDERCIPKEVEGRSLKLTQGICHL